LIDGIFGEEPSADGVAVEEVLVETTRGTRISTRRLMLRPAAVALDVIGW
jgi:hypothetical protein